ncbi:hypothetical protein M438DRAFT_342119 [Aureobasidium pullulans EXF-150]|uniref:Uncharacterized protein n=1 Tax=Aureobasidium pullulans EXF-150 TaxID=1043002 RepID=A0A074XSG9_AURPU|nr:uncharacterized protein M438DRAFT_342119 [Aureobasidium pullulans EXF-150]KEQ88543.1 hypothetical protein M438DRAFT_342119 [Aureobasidium pullulans EXF-150]
MAAPRKVALRPKGMLDYPLAGLQSTTAAVISASWMATDGSGKVVTVRPFQGYLTSRRLVCPRCPYMRCWRSNIWLVVRELMAGCSINAGSVCSPMV